MLPLLLRTWSALVAPLEQVECLERQGLKFTDKAMEFTSVVEPRLVADLLVFADLTGHGLASYCPGPGEVRSVQDRWVILAVTTGSTTRGGAPHQAAW